MTDLTNEKIGQDMVENVLNRVMRQYARLLFDPTFSLRKNELLGSMIEDIPEESREAVAKLLDHCCITTMHALLNFITKHNGDEDQVYAFDLSIEHGGGVSSLLDFSDDPGADLVMEDGWAEKYKKY
ncbi:hypothetical protein EF888_18320 [Silicimonas algicola]|uniref:Uncharacterized protein n=1 Tax=Silicimonas algicola TaxID=1826607 RepID=A0A316G5T6_9RHOB|nr:hypothetical protein [Silicimonas algicola]AZQ68908.1 hypothetical protein EF888_18320 [Silicimonas algicola]PWK55993.1 hypothetical protein C8D95_10555 [Silicimonas algicola]